MKKGGSMKGGKSHMQMSSQQTKKMMASMPKKHPMPMMKSKKMM